MLNRLGFHWSMQQSATTSIHRKIMAEIRRKNYTLDVSTRHINYQAASSTYFAFHHSGNLLFSLCFPLAFIVATVWYPIDLNNSVEWSQFRAAVARKLPVCLLTARWIQIVFKVYNVDGINTKITLNNSWRTMGYIDNEGNAGTFRYNLEWFNLNVCGNLSYCFCLTTLKRTLGDANGLSYESFRSSKEKSKILGLEFIPFWLCEIKRKRPRQREIIKSYMVSLFRYCRRRIECVQQQQQQQNLVY